MDTIIEPPNINFFHNYNTPDLQNHTSEHQRKVNNGVQFDID